MTAPTGNSRQRVRSRLRTLLSASLGVLAWLFLCLESPAWQKFIASRQQLFPQISPAAPRSGDPLRYVVQALWLMFVRTPSRPRGSPLRWLRERAAKCRAGWRRYRQSLPVDAWVEHGARHGTRRLERLSPLVRRCLYGVFGVAAMGLALLCITQPLGYLGQAIFALLVWLAALWVRRRPGQFALLLLIMLSVIVSTRYLWWRYTSTLDGDHVLDLLLGFVLLAAETYAWLILILGFVQGAWPLRRKPQPLPANTSTWPSVDLFIPTYSESLTVVRDTVYAALGMDWPQDKLRVHILDDGDREEFRAFAASAGVDYIRRAEHKHAKAGNLNHALCQTDAELIAVFDCDHIPARSFLQVTVGWFLRDSKLALLQTPHHFLSADPFERNLGTLRMPNEGELFYHCVQDGNDLWNAAFFCGSCAVLRRTALDAVGGFAVETVTEDVHTALRMHRAGWNSAYLRIPQAAGLATDSLADHVKQRIRWARGMAQVFRTDNPLLGRGLTLLQRICYANAMLHFLAGLPRLVFLTAPLAFLLLHAYIIHAPALLLVLYVAPHMAMATLTNGRLFGNHRNIFLGEVYETVLATYIAWATTVALVAPQRGKFNVTAKGGQNDHDRFDWRIASPYLVLAALNLVGLGFAVWRFLYGPADERGTVIVTSVWTIYNLVLLGVTVIVALEARQVRTGHRVRTPLPGSLCGADGHMYPGNLTDYSDGGAGFSPHANISLDPGSPVTLVLRRGDREFAFPGSVAHKAPAGAYGIQFHPMTQAQRIDFVQCTFARADAWLGQSRDRGRDRLMRDLLEVLTLAIRGCGRACHSLPPAPRSALTLPLRAARLLASFRPRHPALRVEPPVKFSAEAQS